MSIPILANQALPVNEESQSILGNPYKFSLSMVSLSFEEPSDLANRHFTEIKNVL